MARIFRKKRIQFIDAGKFKKYAYYAFGEIVLIVVGIFLAFQVNYLSESRKNRLTETTVLSLLREDLVRDVTEFDGYVANKVDPVVPYLTDIYNGSWDAVPLDSLPLLGTSYFNFQPFEAAYQGLKSGGRLSVIDNDSLRRKVIYYYERQYVTLHDWSSWHKNFVTNTLEPYMFNELYIGPDELVSNIDHLKTRLEERRLNSLISTQIGSLRRLREQVQEVRHLAAEIVRDIDTELN